MSDLDLSARVKRRLLRTTLRLPPFLRRQITGPPPENDRGTPLDVDTWWLLSLERRLGAPIAGGPVARARAGIREGTGVVECAERACARVEDLTLAGRPARLYAPPHVTRPPVLLYLHGGGWVVGDLRTHDRLCRRLCAEGGFLVLSLDYRLAPEHRFPAALDDVLAAVPELRERASALGGDPERMAIAGDSAGGNLAAAACLALRDAGGPLPLAQGLLYPAVDMRRLDPSHERFARGFLLEAASIGWYLAHYAPGLLDTRASPVLAEDLSGLPRAVVTTAGFDPLRDEGERYARRLAAAGVDVVHLDAADLVHGYANMDGALPAADREVRRFIAAMRAAVSA